MKPLRSFEFNSYVVSLFVKDELHIITVSYKQTCIRTLEYMDEDKARADFALICWVVQDVYKCEHQITINNKSLN